MDEWNKNEVQNFCIKKKNVHKNLYVSIKKCFFLRRISLKTENERDTIIHLSFVTYSTWLELWIIHICFFFQKKNVTTTQHNKEKSSLISCLRTRHDTFRCSGHAISLYCGNVVNYKQQNIFFLSTKCDIRVVYVCRRILLTKQRAKSTIKMKIQFLFLFLLVLQPYIIITADLQLMFLEYWESRYAHTPNLYQSHFVTFRVSNPLTAIHKFYSFIFCLNFLNLETTTPLIVDKWFVCGSVRLF